MLRIILKLQKEGDKEFFTELPDGRRRYFFDLMSHKNEIEKDPESMEIFQVGNLKKIRKIQLNLEIENSVWKSDFETFWQPVSGWIHKKSVFIWLQ